MTGAMARLPDGLRRALGISRRAGVDRFPLPFRTRMIPLRGASAIISRARFANTRAAAHIAVTQTLHSI
jgi:hypothetical protein